MVLRLTWLGSYYMNGIYSSKDLFKIHYVPVYDDT